MTHKQTIFLASLSGAERACDHRWSIKVFSTTQCAKLRETKSPAFTMLIPPVLPRELAWGWASTEEKTADRGGTDGDPVVGRIPRRNFLPFLLLLRFIFHGELQRCGLMIVSELARKSQEKASSSLRAS